MKRTDECLFCGKRSCNARIVRTESPKYDEIACYKHISDLEQHSDKILGRDNGIMRTHITSSGRLKRGEVTP